MSKNFYITTPIYYVNDRPHIGHAYTTILADVLNRYFQLGGYSSFFLTGTDEHGQKVQQAAKERGISPQEQVDQYYIRFQELWNQLHIKYNRFIRTTEKNHCKYVQKILQELYDKDEIYQETYAGWYSVGEERFFTQDELVDGKDPISGRPVEWLEEKNYFFRMSKYQKRLQEHLHSHPDFILPAFRRNEVIGFLQKPLKNLCISRPRSRLSWGVPLPFDQNFVTYVWFDALLNYESAVTDQTFPDGSPIAPADCHLIGKDILTTHAVYWPSILAALDRPFPKHIFAHGWWLSGKKKVSKSDINASNPLDYISSYGTDSVRYYLMRDMVQGQDSIFTEESFIRRTNSELANDLGNAVNRVHKFILRYLNGEVPQPSLMNQDDEEMRNLAQDLIQKFYTLFPKFLITSLLEEIISYLRQINRYLEKNAPWKLVPSQSNSKSDQKRLASILYCSCESLRIVLTLLSPVIPEKASKGLTMIGAVPQISTSSLEWGILKGGEELIKGDSLFPRI